MNRISVNPPIHQINLYKIVAQRTFADNRFFITKSEKGGIKLMFVCETPDFAGIEVIRGVLNCALINFKKSELLVNDGYKKTESCKYFFCKALIFTVGVKRLELSTPCTPCKCASQLRHTPIASKAVQR